MGIGIGRICAAAWLAAPLLCSVSTAALAQALNYTTFGNPGSVVTTVTGIRGNGMTGDFTIGTGGATAGVLYTLPSLTPAPYPNASAPPVNFTGATTNTPYGLSFGSASGIMRGTGSYKTAANGSGDLGYLFDGANAPGQQLTTLRGAANAFNTIGHSTFGNQLVGNWDTGNAAVGNAFLYNIASGSMTTINRPGPYTSTTAYGVYGNRIAGGSSLGPGLSRAYILNQDTGVYTDYDAPGAGTVVTHFEGITGGGRANTYNLVADSVDGNGVVSSWVVHIDENGVATWIPLAVPGASTTSANSIYGSTAIGVFVQNGVTRAFITTVPGIYNPITNNGALSTATAGTTALQGIQGDDIVNNGTVTTTGVGSVAVNINTYGVVTNRRHGRRQRRRQHGRADERQLQLAPELRHDQRGARHLRDPDRFDGLRQPGVQHRRDQRRGLDRRGLLCPLREQRLDGHQRGRRRRHPRNQRHLRPDLDGHAVAARRAQWRRRPARGQRRGAACRHHADGVPAGHRLQQDLQPGHRDGRPHRHVQHAVDAEPAGFPERQPGLRRHQRDAQPAIVAGHRCPGWAATRSPSARRSTAPSTAAPASMRCRACTACQPARSATR